MSLNNSQLVPPNFHSIEDITSLNVKIIGQQRFDVEGTKPLKLMCAGAQPGVMVFVMAFNKVGDRHHGTADELITKLNQLARQSGNASYEGLEVTFRKLTVERPYYYSGEDVVDPSLCVFYFELTAESDVSLKNDETEFSDLSRWQANDIVDVQNVTVHRVSVINCWEDISFVRIDFVDGQGGHFAAKSYFWYDEHAQDVCEELQHIEGKSVNISGVTREGTAIQLRSRAKLRVYEHEDMVEVIRMSNFGPSDVAVAE